ncbi:MAG: helix-turn-helix domain-containing protein, partial [Bacillota bacterium]
HLMLVLARSSNDTRFLEHAADVIAAEEAMLANPRYQRLELELFGGAAGYPRAATALILALSLGGDQERARAYLQEIAPRALPSAGPDILYCTMKLALVDGRLDEAAEQCSHAAGVALRHRAYREALQLRVGEMMIRQVGSADRPDDLDRVAEQLVALEEEAWRQAGYALVKRGFSMTGVYRFFRGDWQAAYHHVVEATRQDPRAYDGELAWYAGRILLRVGAPEEALPFAEAVPPFRPTDPVSIGGGLLVLPHVLRAEIHVAQGNLGEARVWLEAAESWPALRTAPYYRGSVRNAWAEYFRAVGDSDRAWQSAAEALDASRQAGSAFVAIEAHRLLGELAAARGEIETSVEHFHSSLALAERCRFPMDVALTRLARGRALPGRPEAEADLQEVCAFFSAIGCTPGLAMARRVLKRAAPRVNPRPETASSPLPDGLTAREGEVVTLVCQGMTDREIGARLFISAKTVDRHLRNIFNKTGVNNRAALAAYAVRHGLLP